jgi:hypothetical protein
MGSGFMFSKLTFKGCPASGKFHATGNSIRQNF